VKDPFKNGFHKLRTRQDLILFNEDLAKPEFFDMMASNNEIFHYFCRRTQREYYDEPND
jgi:hypothetical protein